MEQQQQQQQLCLLLPGAGAVAEAVAECIWHPTCIQPVARFFSHGSLGFRCCAAARSFHRCLHHNMRSSSKVSGLGCGWLRGRGPPTLVVVAVVVFFPGRDHVQRQRWR